MQYQIIRKTSLEDLQNLVNDLINADWRPIGGLTIDGIDTERYYLQAMFRANATDAFKERVRREEGNGPFGLW
ncbi:MAG: hypothetical protein P8L25_11665 [Paracoccaceae bacterium]|jgi:hypothetical protein|nr:hypothetical protein [Paracoccaceae bacterium]